MNENLKIYRASAGSGKTFTLALEYIKLLIKNPSSYRNILAVTFTNKATAEMKERILCKLYGVANRLDDAKDYMAKIKEQMPELDEQTITARAQTALDMLLHDYGHFRIQTIDAFFQSVLRGLAKELDLNGDIEISLDDKELLGDAVDTYIKQLEPGSANFKQVIDYIEEKLLSGKRWRVNNELKEFAKNITKEEYQERGEELRKQIESNGDLLTDFRKAVKALNDSLDSKAKKLAARFSELAEGYSTKDFKRGAASGSTCWVFNKMSEVGVCKISPALLALADTPSEISSVCPYVDEIAMLIKEASKLVTTQTNCKLVLEKFHQLGMLNNIADILKEENARENRFLLADTSHLLSTMVANNTSFIFEKIGTEIEHVFIDEFQDTSKLQWICFEVLLKEILSRGNFNLIVGDVKQSIYRWRNSDWNIMNNIGDKFRDDQITFANQDVKVDGTTYKSTNYRSDRRIVDFNNTLYRASINTIGSSYIQDIGKDGIAEIKQAYSDVEQAVPAKKPDEGYVEVLQVKKTEAYADFVEAATAQLMQTLHRLLDEENVAPGDITILTRYNYEVQRVVEAFDKEFDGIKIVSDEAYKLSSSLTVQLVISALRYIATPSDRINIANLVKLYDKVIKGTRQDFTCSIDSNIEDLLPEEFCKSLQKLKGLPLYEMIEQLLALLNVSKSKDEEAYIYTFLDHVSQFINSRSSDINKLLNAWDEKISGKCIPAESLDSVRVMTIHKSKGLEFHTVIIPFCNWILTGDTRTLLWCKPTAAPFDKLSLLPIKCKSDLRESMFDKEYYSEYMYQVVDNLNILYVATTRAKSNLFVFTNADNGTGENMSKLVNKVVENIKSLPGFGYNDNADGTMGANISGCLTYGHCVSCSKTEGRDVEVKSENPFDVEPEVNLQPFTYYDSKIEFRQSNETERFLAKDEEEVRQYGYIEDGKLMHLVMSEISHANDISKALDKLMIEGLISSAEHYERIKRLIEKAISNKDAAGWFDGTYKLYNECAILSNGETKSRRPDRVMVKDNEAIVIDYKFGKEREEYYDQVKNYMELLKAIGYTNVKGFVWYVYKNYIKEV